ncbi:cyclic AMP-responsive element-binding protein 3-like protein 1 [Diachasma alloeum]|uniref:cyclic AMP-responsive element-binding protein 3-like protein 1 n=1 Tax=Diachasma alloeum TaxID=454923 RepID=UPI0007383214|nr:cyclic AMP-responsive element-binding protein 3-like protein 1 [Diachasma alloeum]
MTSTSPEMTLMQYLFDRDDPMLKENIKDDVLMKESCVNETIAAEEWMTSNTDDLFGSIFNMDDQFNLIDNDLETIPSSSSDSGLSSALSLSCEQQLSPLLPIDDDQVEIGNDSISSPPNYTEFDSLGSPNDSMGSIDSPVRSVMSSNLGSPGTDINEEMEFEPMLTVVDSGAVENPEMTMPVIKQEPMADLDAPLTQQMIKQEPTVTIRNAGNGKRNIRQLIRVTPSGAGNHPRSILLPVSLKDMKEVRAIKIINATQARNLKNFKISHINQGNVISKAIPMNVKQEDTSLDKSVTSDDETCEPGSGYPPLKLNAEEKRLLQKEGITLPTHYPLTKPEERELKRIRRKIRNKISAQDSRKRKKEYVDGLEDRVKQCTEENMTLLKRIKALQTQNQSLAGQLKRLQALIQKGNKSAQPATCLMVLLLSLALVAVPNLRPHSSNNTSELAREQEQPEKMPPLAGRSRSLLFTKQLMDEELQQYGELLEEVEGLLDHDYSPVVQVPLYKRPRYDDDQPSKYTTSMSHVGGTLNQKTEFSDSKLSKKYIEPPLDDVWPPPKPGVEPGARVVDKLEALTNELKINISDAEGTRTVLLKVPQEQ